MKSEKDRHSIYNLIEDIPNITNEEADKVYWFVNSIAGKHHDYWRHWIKYLFSRAEHNPDGSITIDREYVDKWLRRMNFEYNALSGREQSYNLDMVEQFFIEFIRYILIPNEKWLRDGVEKIACTVCKYETMVLPQMACETCGFSLMKPRSTVAYDIKKKLELSNRDIAERIGYSLDHVRDVMADENVRAKRHPSRIFMEKLFILAFQVHNKLTG